MAGFIKVAHRGASGHFPENTRLAFEKAIEARADMIELDCQLSRDGHVVVFHDERLNRTARARGKISEKTLEQLKKLDVGRWRKKAFQGERILTIEEVLQFVAGNIDLCIEIKHFPQSPHGIELKLLFILSHYDCLDRTIISSFNYHCLDRVRELAPESRVGVLFGADSKEDPFAAARRLNATSIHIQKDLATREFVDQAWEDGLDVHVWTVNEVRDMEKFASLGVQGIVSDYPEKFWKLKFRPKS
ncbi:MAG TPA: glycerophosphodiester phosphodiesterase family protein [Candidatus Udaeobacter sp.]|nr:glycerophosphodiester phosphodiesterase family protein [Candidatus Udaeobacter sp.]